MKIELSPTKIVPGAYTVWNQAGPDVDQTVDLKALPFRDGSIDEIYAFHVLDHLFEEEIRAAMQSWTKCLKVGGRLVVICDDFEYLARAFVGGDIGIDEFNQMFTHPTNISRDNLLRYFTEQGFSENTVNQWFGSIIDPAGAVIVPKQEVEIIFESKKHE